MTYLQRYVQCSAVWLLKPLLIPFSPLWFRTPFFPLWFRTPFSALWLRTPFSVVLNLWNLSQSPWIGVRVTPIRLGIVASGSGWCSASSVKEKSLTMATMERIDSATANLAPIHLHVPRSSIGTLFAIVRRPGLTHPSFDKQECLKGCFAWLETKHELSSEVWCGQSKFYISLPHWRLCLWRPCFVCALHVQRS